MHEEVRLSVGIILMATYWEIDRGIVEYEQCGRRRLERLSRDLPQRFGRGFGYASLILIWQFYLCYRERRAIL